MQILVRDSRHENLSIKSTVYFDHEVYQALQTHAAHNQVSMSALVNEAVELLMHEDQEDLAAFAQRAAESEINRKALLAKLKQHGKL